MKNYYEILEVSEQATPDEIKSSYRALSKKHHPDVGGDEEKFKEISQAYETLSNQEKKAQYDHMRKYGHAGAGNAEQQFQDMVREMHRRQAEEMHKQMNRGSDIAVTVQLTLEETLKEAVVDVTYIRRNMTIRQMEQVTEKIQIPAGVMDGQGIRINGKGNDSSVVGAYSGDLIVRVVVLKHAKFAIVDGVLKYTTYLPFSTMALGGEVEVPTLGGSPVKFQLPSGTKSGSVFSLKGKGLPTEIGSTERSNMIVVAHVYVPDKLSDEERQKIEEVKEIFE